MHTYNMLQEFLSVFRLLFYICSEIWMIYTEMTTFAHQHLIMGFQRITRR